MRHLPHHQGPRHDHRNPDHRLARQPARRNTWELLFAASVGAAKSPGSTRVRQGFVLPGEVGMIDILPASIGERVAGGVRIRPDRRGQVFVCPCVDLATGRWRFELRFEPDSISI